LLNEIYNVIGALRDCLAVKYNSCNNLPSSVYNISVIISASVTV